MKPSQILTAVSIACLLLGMSGCVQNYQDISATERAVRINKHLEAGRDYMRQLGDSLDIDLDTKSGSDRAIAICKLAIAEFEEALVLDRSSGRAPSAKPRLALGNSLHNLSLTYAHQMNIARNNKDTERAKMLKAEAQTNARKSNKVLEFYLNRLYRGKPEPTIFEVVAMNNVILERHAKAADVLSDLLQNVKLPRAAQESYRKQIRALREKALEDS